ncbi:MAG: LamG-like jellyroll fold domain-containing protein [Microscillaceae bacterium]|nr:LamG-like jellyroll fold domain-containing protein [Microscillaceae bacterium]
MAREIKLFLLWTGALLGYGIPQQGFSQCTNISPNNCTTVVVGMPFALEFTGTEGGILEKDGQQTGFTMIQAHSAARLAADAPVSDPIVNAYEPSRLDVAINRLSINASKGLAFTTSNNQVNTLGVGLQAAGKSFVIESNLRNVNTGGSFAQMGIWYGLNDENYIKFVALNNNSIQFIVEQNGLSPASSQKTVIVENFAGLSMRLRLFVDNIGATQKVRAFCQIGARQEIYLGELSHNFGNGINLDASVQNVSFAGVFASYRNGSTFTATFEDFSVTEYNSCYEISTLPCPNVLVALPYTLDFDGTEGGLADQSGTATTGFTMIQASREDRMPEDLPAHPSVKSYLPSRISLNTGQLQLTASRGIAFRTPVTSTNTNNQVNTLGVGLQANGRQLLIETNLSNNSTGGGFAQVGLWYGLDDDNFAKLAVINDNTIELSVEQQGGAISPSSIISLGGLNLANKNIRFRMVVDNRIGQIPVVRGYYSIAGGADIYVGEIQHDFNLGITLTDGITSQVSFAGIYASYRNGSAFVSRFNDFSIGDFLVFNPTNLNFIVEEGGTTAPQMATLSASSGNPIVTLTKNPGSPTSDWLVSAGSSALGNVNFSINASGILAGTTLQTQVIASAPNYLDTSLTVTLEVIPKQLTFTPNQVHATLLEGGSIESRTVNLFSSAGTIPVSLSKSAGSDWLILPLNPTTGDLTFQFDPATLSPGDTRTATVTATSGSATALLNIEIYVIGPGTDLQFNFQDNSTATPAGWIKDFGEPFGIKIGANQGAGLNFGWKQVSDAMPVNVTTQGRVRTNPVGNVIQQTFMHMQPGTANNFWELTLPNGPYTIEVSVGDGGGFTNSTHAVRAEGQTVIAPFVPTPNQFKTEIRNILLEDGSLTLDALGGTNTKINSVVVRPLSGVLRFDTTKINFVTFVGQNPVGQTVVLSSSPGTPAFTVTYSQNEPIAATNPGWLVPPLIPTYGDWAIQIDAAALPAGLYNAFIEVSSPDYLEAVLEVQLTVLDPAQAIQVNFQDQNTIPPTGWLKDFGQAFGNRTDAFQGSGLVYGWIDNTADKTPVDISLNGRNRNTAATGIDILQASLMHMQFDDIARPNGTPLEGVWEITLPNGTYKVTATVGDLNTEETNTTTHQLNVENLPFVVGFNPDALNRFATVTDTIVIEDGRLTLDAFGGFNTKITHLSIEKVSQEFLSFEPKAIELDIIIGETVPDQSVVLSASAGVPTGLSFSESPAAAWLNPPAAALGNLSLGIDIAGLPEGTYQTTVIASAPGYVQAPLKVTVRVIDVNWGLNINFQPTGVGIPAGYLPDYGNAYGNRGNGHTYGWIDTLGNPGANTLYARNRDVAGVETRLNTLNHMQFAGVQPRNWELEIPNGTYFINISVGDPAFDNSVHSILVEGQDFITAFDEAATGTDFRSVVRKIEVTDGKLTVEANPLMGVNTKINYIRIGSEDLLVNQFREVRPVLAGAKNRRMVRLELEKVVAADMMTAASFTFETGLSNPADIENAKIYYTGADSTFSNTTQVGLTSNNPNGTFTIDNINQTLSNGKNYFWLSYDLSSGAVPGNTLEANVIGAIVGVTNYTFPATVGSRIISIPDTLPLSVLDFNNIGEITTVSNQLVMPEEFTLEGWFYPNQNGPAPRWMVGQVGGTHLEQVGGEVHLYVFANGTLQGPATATLPFEEWNHVAATYNGDSLRLYVNGKEGNSLRIGSTSFTFPNEDQDTTFAFGAQNVLSTPNDMLMDEIRLWHRARSLFEIRESMHLVSNGQEADLQNYWQFNNTASGQAESIELVNEQYAQLSPTVALSNGLEPVGKGLSHTEFINSGDGTTPTVFGATNLEITFNTNHPEGNVVVTYILSQPLGVEPAPDPDFSKTRGYWIVNNYGKDTIDPVTMKFKVEDGTVLSTSPNEYFLHKRGSREAGDWIVIGNAVEDVIVTIDGSAGNNFIQFAGGPGSVNLKSFSQFIVSSDQSALPLSIISFTGKRLDAQSIRLDWIVKHESELTRYEIQQSDHQEDFISVISLDGKGKDSPDQEYLQLLSNSSSAFYRVKVIEGNGNVFFSPVIFVEGNETSEILRIYPNPVVEHVRIQVDELLENEVIPLILMDAQGKTYLEINARIEELNERLNQKIQELAAGLYILRLSTSLKAFTFRLIKN